VEDARKFPPVITTLVPPVAIPEVGPIAATVGCGPGVGVFVCVGVGGAGVIVPVGVRDAVGVLEAVGVLVGVEVGTAEVGVRVNVLVAVGVDVVVGTPPPEIVTLSNSETQSTALLWLVSGIPMKTFCPIAMVSDPTSVQVDPSGEL
jgi:hypothetical protein